MQRTIYQHRNQPGTTELSLGLTTEGVVLYFFSVFDTDTGETDTCSSRPFSVSGFRNALENLMSKQQCELVESGQRLQIKKDTSESVSKKPVLVTIS